jgi:hypothetical protein
MNAVMVQTIVMLMLNVQTALVASVVNAGMDTVEMVLIVKTIMNALLVPTIAIQMLHVLTQMVASHVNVMLDSVELECYVET